MKVRTIAAAAVLAFAAVGASAQEPYVIKFSADSSSAGDVCKTLIPGWKTQVEAESKGRIKVEIYCDGLLSKMGDTVDRVAAGVAQAGWELAFPYGKRFNDLNVVGLPGLYNDPEVAAGALWNYYLTDPGGLKTTLESQKVKMIWLQAAPNSAFYMTRKMDAANFAGAKVAAGNKQRAIMVQQMGGVPLRVSVPDYYTSLSKGALDGTMTTTGAIAAYKIQEITKYYLFGPFGGGYTLGIMNLDFYNKLPDDLKKVIDDASGYERSRWTSRILRDYEDKFMKAEMLTLPDREQHFLSEAELKAWKPALDAASKDWIDSTENGQALYAAFKAKLDAEVKRYGHD